MKSPTGRIIRGPNLQVIPVRTPQGNAIKRAFLGLNQEKKSQTDGEKAGL